MTGWLFLVALLCAATPSPPGGTVSACRDRELAEKFVAFASPSYDYSPAGLEEAFRPHAAALETCLKRWVEDGGDRDGVPLLGNDVNRERYRVFAIALLGQLYPNSEEVASWIRSNFYAWPTALRGQGVNTLGEMRSRESFPFLKAEALKTEGERRELIWNSLLFLDGQRFALELESIAPTHEEQVLVGSMLIVLNQPVVLPALRRLKVLVPEKAGVYAEHIREIEKQDGGEHDDGN